MQDQEVDGQVRLDDLQDMYTVLGPMTMMLRASVYALLSHVVVERYCRRVFVLRAFVSTQ